MCALTSHRPVEPHRPLSGVLTAPKSKIQFNGVGGLRTYISLRASQSVFPRRARRARKQGDDRGSHGTVCFFQHQHFPGSRSRRGSMSTLADLDFLLVLIATCLGACIVIAFWEIEQFRERRRQQSRNAVRPIRRR
jgi:hypothetical protein